MSHSHTNLKITDSDLIIPINSEVMDEIVVAVLQDTRKSTFQNIFDTAERVAQSQVMGDHHREDVATSMVLLQAIDTVLEHFGAKPDAY